MTESSVSTRPHVGVLADLVDLLAGIDGSGSDQDLLDALTELERVRAAAAAAQARVTVAFAQSQQRQVTARAARSKAAAAEGFEAWRAAREADRRRGVGEQVGLARRLSPWQGARALNFALALTADLPGTLAALGRGELSEWRAIIIARQTSHLAAADRRAVDAEICHDRALASWGDRELECRVKAAAYRRDAVGSLQRASAAARDRHVSLRPLPDTMSRLSALLPVAQGVAAFAALSRQADTARAAGDPRSRGQVMADTLVERITGQATAAGVPVEVQVVLSDAALFGSGPGADDPAQVPGYGTVPAGWVRDLLAGSDADTGDAGRAATAEARVWLRRLYATPDRSRLVAMESRRRAFGRGLRRFLVTRDGGRCRAPWCDAPIRHLDHVADHGGGGATAARNGQGLCERCNQTKTLPGWRVEVADDGSRGSPHRTRWRTPAGTVYDATAPPLLPGAVPIGAEPAVPTQSRIELALAAALAA